MPNNCHTGIKGNVWHCVTHIQEYLGLNISLIITYYRLEY